MVIKVTYRNIELGTYICNGIAQGLFTRIAQEWGNTVAIECKATIIEPEWMKDD